MSFNAFISGLEKWRKKTENTFKRQAAFAAQNAMNQAAFEIKKLEEKEMLDSFDRPTPYTMRGVRVNKANFKAKINQAEVFINRETAKGIPHNAFLAAEIKGGGRRLKRSEKLLIAAGVMPPGSYMVPGRRADLDQYGNLSRGLIIKVISFFRAFPENGYKANSTPETRARRKKGTKKRLGYEFVYRWDSLGGGTVHQVFANRGERVVMVFVKNVSYEERFEFFYTGNMYLKRNMTRIYQEQFKRALATSR